MDKINLIYAIGLIILCVIVLMVYINTVYGDIITPYNTHNNNITSYINNISKGLMK